MCSGYQHETNTILWHFQRAFQWYHIYIPLVLAKFTTYKASIGPSNSQTGAKFHVFAKLWAQQSLKVGPITIFLRIYPAKMLPRYSSELTNIYRSLSHFMFHPAVTRHCNFDLLGLRRNIWKRWPDSIFAHYKTSNRWQPLIPNNTNQAWKWNGKPTVWWQNNQTNTTYYRSKLVLSSCCFHQTCHL